MTDETLKILENGRKKLLEKKSELKEDAEIKPRLEEFIKNETINFVNWNLNKFLNIFIEGYNVKKEGYYHIEFGSDEVTTSLEYIHFNMEDNISQHTKMARKKFLKNPNNFSKRLSAKEIVLLINQYAELSHTTLIFEFEGNGRKYNEIININLFNQLIEELGMVSRHKFSKQGMIISIAVEQLEKLLSKDEEDVNELKLGKGEN